MTDTKTGLAGGMLITFKRSNFFVEILSLLPNGYAYAVWRMAEGKEFWKTVIIFAIMFSEVTASEFAHFCIQLSLFLLNRDCLKAV